ncbi:hypothetical protein GSI01S_33_00660 [Gordonia sihwensis NBRC 108236]|uniref:Uncharacterized protein n=1 Tax=Gordonia sihwensis NBRC 108236 TaxID=1223544 RepID=L7LML3_9ACTN|nr:hypothetical protein GSI01S_33_00660 [Gordonia sihwensis NBRC 108236]
MFRLTPIHRAFLNVTECHNGQELADRGEWDKRRDVTSPRWGSNQPDDRDSPQLLHRLSAAVVTPSAPPRAYWGDSIHAVNVDFPKAQD